MTGWVSDADGVKQQITDIWVGDATGTRRKVITAWVGDATDAPKVWFQTIAPATLTATANHLSQITLTWTNVGADRYDLYRGSTPVINTTLTTYVDKNLSPGTLYSYRLDVVKSGSIVQSVTASATTPPTPNFAMTATKSGQTRINTAWTSLGAGWTYNLKGNGTTILTGTTATSYAHTVAAGSTVAYVAQAVHSGKVRNSASASATTDPKPPDPVKHYATAYSNVGWESWGGWTASSQRVLGGPNIAVPVGGTFTNMVALVYGRGGVAFRGEPRINGVAGPQQVYTVGRSHTNWPFSLGFAAGTFTTAVVVGGSNWGSAEWSPWTGQRWDYYCQVNQLDYYYWTGLKAFEDLRKHEWWDRELEDPETPPLYLETWTDPDNPDSIIRARISNHETKEKILEWEADNG